MKKIPLFIIYGLSGSGKSITTIKLAKIMGVRFNVYDMDDIVVNQDFYSASRNWLSIALANARNRHVTILLGSVPSPYCFYDYNLFRIFSPVHYMLLHCSAAIRAKRLESRGTWTQEGIVSTILAAHDMYAHAESLGRPIIDTTDLPAIEVAELLKKWILSSNR